MVQRVSRRMLLSGAAAAATVLVLPPPTSEAMAATVEQARYMVDERLRYEMQDMVSRANVFDRFDRLSNSGD